LLSLYGCWHGVCSWSPAIPGLVQTSTNLALVRQENGTITVGTSQRSSLESEKEFMAETVASVFRLAGARVEFGDGYPGWTPNPDSLVLKITRQSYKELFGQEPAVKAIHAGLECGLFLERYPGMDMISFGPTIRGAHTPEEKLDIPSTRKFWLLLTDVLKRI
jgi:dipeptidase D